MLSTLKGHAYWFGEPQASLKQKACALKEEATFREWAF